MNNKRQGEEQSQKEKAIKLEEECHAEFKIRVLNDELFDLSSEESAENGRQSGRRADEDCSHESQDSEILELKEWIIESRISHSLADKLLKILRCRVLPNLPKNTNMLLQSNISTVNETDRSTEKITFVDVNKGLGSATSADSQLTGVDHQNNILDQLAAIREDVAYIKAHQDNISRLIPIKFLETDFSTKYAINLPIIDFSDFLKFDNDLTYQHSLRADVMRLLRNNADSDQCRSLTKTVTSMLKMFISRDLANHFTAARKSRLDRETIKFKDTRLWTCITDVLVLAKNSLNLNVSDKEMLTSLSDSLSYSKKW